MSSSQLIWLLPFVCLGSCGRTDVVRFDLPLLTLDSGVEAGADAGRTDAGALDAGFCPPGFVLMNGQCVEVAARLDGLRWELPCLRPDPGAPEYVCFTSPDVRAVAAMRGPPGRSYDVRVRIRGVVETRAYEQGTLVAPFVRRGGRSVANPADSDPWNIYRLDVSDPREHWYVNSGPSGEYVCRVVDASFTVRVRSGATVTLFASAVDSRLSQIRNRAEDGGALVAPDVPPAPRAFDGQFLQLDVLSVAEVP